MNCCSESYSGLNFSYSYHEDEKSFRQDIYQLPKQKVGEVTFEF